MHGVVEVLACIAPGELTAAAKDFGSWLVQETSVILLVYTIFNNSSQIFPSVKVRDFEEED